MINFKILVVKEIPDYENFKVKVFDEEDENEVFEIRIFTGFLETYGFHFPLEPGCRVLCALEGYNLEKAILFYPLQNPVLGADYEKVNVFFDKYTIEIGKKEIEIKEIKSKKSFFKISLNENNADLELNGNISITGDLKADGKISSLREIETKGNKLSDMNIHVHSIPAHDPTKPVLSLPTKELKL